MKWRETGDGSKTLHQQDLDVCYHSVHGAWTETQHVFGEMGVMPAFSRNANGDIHVLEIGFGTGLNVLDVWLRAKAAGRHAVVHSLEPHPLSWEEAAPWTTRHPPGCRRKSGVRCTRGTWHDEWITFERVKTGLFEAPLWEQSYDVVLFDAFAPGAQPELWTVRPWIACVSP